MSDPSHMQQSPAPIPANNTVLLMAIFSLVLVLAAVAGGAYTIGQQGAGTEVQAKVLVKRLDRVEARVDRIERVYERIVRLESRVKQGFVLLNQRLDRMQKREDDKSRWTRPPGFFPPFAQDVRPPIHNAPIPEIPQPHPVPWDGQHAIVPDGRAQARMPGPPAIRLPVRRVSLPIRVRTP